MFLLSRFFLQGFREGKFRCLVATDVAARGLDIPEVDLVVQCEPPKVFQTLIRLKARNVKFYSALAPPER